MVHQPRRPTNRTSTREQARIHKTSDASPLTDYLSQSHAKSSQPTSASRVALMGNRLVVQLAPPTFARGPAACTLGVRHVGDLQGGQRRGGGRRRGGPDGQPPRRAARAPPTTARGPAAYTLGVRHVGDLQGGQRRGGGRRRGGPDGQPPRRAARAPRLPPAARRLTP